MTERRDLSTNLVIPKLPGKSESVALRKKQKHKQKANITSKNKKS